MGRIGRRRSGGRGGLTPLGLTNGCGWHRTPEGIAQHGAADRSPAGARPPSARDASGG
jgi:hypothetical protein